MPFSGEIKVQTFDIWESNRKMKISSALSQDVSVMKMIMFIWSISLRFNGQPRHTFLFENFITLEKCHYMPIDVLIYSFQMGVKHQCKMNKTTADCF